MNNNDACPGCADAHARLRLFGSHATKSGFFASQYMYAPNTVCQDETLCGVECESNGTAS